MPRNEHQETLLSIADQPAEEKAANHDVQDGMSCCESVLASLKENCSWWHLVAWTLFIGLVVALCAASYRLGQASLYNSPGVLSWPANDVDPALVNQTITSGVEIDEAVSYGELCGVTGPDASLIAHSFLLHQVDRWYQIYPFFAALNQSVREEAQRVFAQGKFHLQNGVCYLANVQRENKTQIGTACLYGEGVTLDDPTHLNFCGDPILEVMDTMPLIKQPTREKSVEGLSQVKQVDSLMHEMKKRERLAENKSQFFAKHAAMSHHVKHEPMRFRK